MWCFGSIMHQELEEEEVQVVEIPTKEVCYNYVEDLCKREGESLARKVIGQITREAGRLQDQYSGLRGVSQTEIVELLWKTFKPIIDQAREKKTT